MRDTSARDDRDRRRGQRRLPRPAHGTPGRPVGSGRRHRAGARRRGPAPAEPHPERPAERRDRRCRSRRPRRRVRRASAAVELSAVGTWAARKRFSRVSPGSIRWSSSAGWRRVDFIKIDVDGQEARVLRGALGTLRRFRPPVLFELTPTAVAADGESVEELFGALLDWATTVSDEGGTRWHDPSRQAGVCDEAQGAISSPCRHRRRPGPSHQPRRER